MGERDSRTRREDRRSESYAARIRVLATGSIVHSEITVIPFVTPYSPEGDAGSAITPWR